MQWSRTALVAVGVLAGPTASVHAQFVPGGREIYALSLSSGSAPSGVRVLPGSQGAPVVIHEGRAMLKASSLSEFVIDLPEKLPDNFTLQFEIIPKQCCNPEDLFFAGTSSKVQSGNSAEFSWHRNSLTVTGGGPQFTSDMPADLRETLPGALTSIDVSFDGETVKLYTNGRRLFTLTERRFARGRVLRVRLGGQDDADQAVYLSKLRVATGPPVVAQQPPPPAPAPQSVVLMPPPPPPAPAPPSVVLMPPPAPPAATGMVTPATSAAPAVNTPTSPSTATDVIRTRDATVMAPPTNLTVTGTPATATLTWQAPTGWTPTGYTVVRHTVGSTESSALTNAPIRAMRFDDQSGLSAGKSFVYVVTALSGDPRAFGTAQTPFTPPAPQNVSNVTAKAAGANVTIAWTGVSGATKYLVIGASAVMAREVPGTETQVIYQSLAPGSYTWSVGARFEPGPVETPASTWPSVTLAFLAPRNIVLTGLNTAGQYATSGPRMIILPALIGAGGSTTSAARRTITFGGFAATASTTTTAPPSITLPGVIGLGGFASLAPRSLTLSGISAAGGFTPPGARTITLPGLIAAGIPPVP